MAHLENARAPSADESFDSLLKFLTRVAARAEFFLPAFITLSFLGLWELAARLGWIQTLFFPAPSVIWLSAQRLIVSGDLSKDLGATLSRVVVGFLLGGLPGLILGLLMGWSARLRALVDPFIAAIHPMPKISLFPLLMIFFGVGEVSKVLLIAIGTFFPMLLNAMAGVRQISPIHFEVAQNYGASAFKLFTRVIAPGALPWVLSGMRLAFNIALLLTVAIEITNGREGVGARIWLAWQTFRIEELYVTLAIMAALGFVINSIINRVTHWLVPWRLEREEWKT